MIEQKLNTLFTSKYAPTKIENIVLPDRIVTKFKDLTEVNINYLFYGPPGTGKTTLAKLLAEKHEFLYVEEPRIDFLRKDIIEFISEPTYLKDEDGEYLLDDNSSVMIRPKVVIIDETDGASKEFWEQLRILMNKDYKYYDNARYICTTNHLDKIDSALLSRMVKIDFNYTFDDNKECMVKAAKRCSQIAKNENLTIKGVDQIEDKKNKIKYIYNFYKKFVMYFSHGYTPDMRSCINELQVISNSVNKELDIDNYGNFSDFVYEDVIKLIFSNLNSMEIYGKLYKHKNSASSVLISLSEEIFEYLKINKINITPYVFGEFVRVLAEYLYKQNFTPNKFVNLVACVNELQNKYLNSK